MNENDQIVLAKFFIEMVKEDPQFVAEEFEKISGEYIDQFFLRVSRVIEDYE